MTLFEIIFILSCHFIADFIFQSENWATNKSSSFSALLNHTSFYTLVLLILFTLTLYIGIEFKPEWYWGIKMLWLFPITFVAHTITDYFTSKKVKSMFENKNYGSPIPNFGAFTVIGFDQLLHYIQLFVTYQLLK